MARNKKNRQRRRKARLSIDTLPNLDTIQAAAPVVPDSFFIQGASEALELLADAGPTGDAVADAKPKLKKFAMVAYTGGAMNVGFGMPVVVDLEGLSVPRQANPILMSHDTSSIVGHTDKVDVSAQRVKLSGVISGVGDAAQEVQATAANGFPWQASIGASIQQREYVDAGKTVNVNGRNFSGPIMVARKSVLGEVSFVPLGADQNTSATVAAQQQGENAVNFESWLKGMNLDVATLSDAAKTSLRAAYDAEVKLKATGTPPVVTPPAQTPTPPIDFAAELQKQLEAGRKAMADEAKRVTDIELRCAKHGAIEVEIPGTDGKSVKVNLKEHAIRANWSADQVELHALRAARPLIEGGLAYSTSRPDMSEAVLEAAMLHATRHEFKLEDNSFYFETVEGSQIRRVPERLQREAQGELKARYTDQVQQAAHTMFKGRVSPHQVFEACLRGSGHMHRQLDMKSESGIRSMLATWDHADKERMIRAEGASSMSISNVLANVMNKFALQGYLYTEQAYRDFCAVRSVNDFKPAKSINLLGNVMFKALGPTGELANFSLGDQAFANVAAPYGGILTIPWTHLVNDDLGILTGVPRKVGQGAGLALNDAIWALWKAMAAGTTNGDDGNAFWRTTSSLTAAAGLAGTAYNLNKISGGSSALSSTSLTTAKKAFDNQVDPNSNPLGFDGTMPILLFGPSNWRAATELLRYSQLVGTGQTSTPLQPQGNVWAGTMKPVMSRYIENANYVNSATAFWILFDPAALAVIELAFLNGVDTPAVLQAGPDYQFDRLGISIRGTMPFGVTQQNFRGGVYSVGA